MTSFIDGYARDVAYALRTFRRTPVVAVTIVTTVGLGLGLVTVLFTVLNFMAFRVDDVPNVHELFGVERPRLANDERVRFTRPQYEDLRRETGVFSDVAAMLPDIDSRVDGRMMSGSLVTGNFFEMLGVGATHGRTLTPADDQRFAANPVVVLSYRGWTKHFANDRGAIGRRLLINGFEYQIVGVMPDGFRGLEVSAPTYWAPLSLLGQVRPIHAGREDLIGVDVIGRLKPGFTRKSALDGLIAWDSGRVTGGAFDRRTANIILEPRRGTIPQPHEAVIVFTPLFFAFGLVLMIGCANVTNLLLARGVSRQREIGIRLSLGASRRRIIRQLLTESLLLSVASAALGFVIARVAMEAAIYAVVSTLALEISEVISLAVPPWDWRVLAFLAVGAVVSTAFFGLTPALQSTRLELVRTMRGEVTRDARPRRSRNVLIGLQVTASALLLICSAVFLRSAMSAATSDPGIRTSDTIVVEINNEPKREAMVRAVAAEPAVTTVAAAWPDPMDRPRAAFAETAPGAGSAGGRSPVAYKFVSPEFFGVLDIAILQGRAFRFDERTADAAVVVVSESVARELWPHGNALGQILHLDPDPNSETRREDEPPLLVRTFTVVGIARDVAGFRFADFKQAGVYVPIGASHAKTSLIARVQGDPDEARRALLRTLTAVDPNMGQVVTLRAAAKLETYLLGIAFWTTMVIGGLALVLTVTGLFSVLSYLVEQRRKEIGVRMALGATTRNIGRLVLSQTIRPVLIGLSAGVGLAVSLGFVLVSTPAAQEIGASVQMLDPVAYIGSLLCIITACALAVLVPTLRATRVDPIQQLRQD